MRRLVERASLLLVVINALFLIAVIGTLTIHWSTWTAVVELPTEAIERGPAAHLPLAGMDGATYSAEDACLRLNGFLMEMARSLGGDVEVSAADIHTVVVSGQCTLDDPDVRKLIVIFRDAYQQAGLEPLSPFSMVD